MEHRAKEGGSGISKQTAPKQKYRVHTDINGRLRILPIPSTGVAAVKFHCEIRKIAKDLFKVGASLDSICGSHGELIFQHPQPQVNKDRVAQIIKIWKEKQSLQT